MPLTKVTKSLINTVSASQIVASGATAGQVLTYNRSTSTWVASISGTADLVVTATSTTGFTAYGPDTGNTVQYFAIGV